jgi:uncharacterized protein YbjT (DUF2867 family)
VGSHRRVEPSTSVDSLTGEGLADAVAGADVLVDVADSPSFDNEPVMHFFTTTTTTTTTNLLSAEREAGVKHHVALSVVGAQIMPDSGYNTAKTAQENLIKDSGRPYSIVRATPFYEFAVGLADSATDGDIVRLPHALFRPIAADDVATAVPRAAVGRPINGVMEIAGPEATGMDDFVRTGLAANGKNCQELWISLSGGGLACDRPVVVEDVAGGELLGFQQFEAGFGGACE